MENIHFLIAISFGMAPHRLSYRSRAVIRRQQPPTGSELKESEMKSASEIH